MQLLGTLHPCQYNHETIYDGSASSSVVDDFDLRTLPTIFLSGLEGRNAKGMHEVQGSIPRSMKFSMPKESLADKLLNIGSRSES